MIKFSIHPQQTMDIEEREGSFVSGFKKGATWAY